MKKWFVWLVMMVIIVLPAAVLAGSSQSDGLDSSRGPNFYYGYLPDVADPIIVSMLSGGSVNVRDQGIGNCSGFVTSSPDVQIELLDRLPVLRAFYSSTQRNGDTTLTVQLPNGSFVCNDDFTGLDPLIEISSPSTGVYSFWVGSFNEREYVPGYLVITGGESSPGAIDAPVLTNLLNVNNIAAQPTPGGNRSNNINFGELFNQPTQAPPTATPLPPPTIIQSTPQGAPTSTPVSGESGGGTLTIGGAPTNGTAVLAADFAPDPNTVDMIAGGSVDLRAQNLGDPLCRGFSGSNPDYRISYAGGGTLLRIFFTSRGDTTIVIRTPSGQFLCNDDFPGALNPLVDISSPPAGDYDVWVGVYEAGAPVEGTLYVTGSTTIDPTTERK